MPITKINDSQINSVQLKKAREVSTSLSRTDINLLKTHFKIDTYRNASINQMAGMMLDTFATQTGVDAGRSQYTYDTSLKLAKHVGAETSVPNTGSAFAAFNHDWTEVFPYTGGYASQASTVPHSKPAKDAYVEVLADGIAKGANMRCAIDSAGNIHIVFESNAFNASFLNIEHAVFKPDGTLLQRTQITQDASASMTLVGAVMAHSSATLPSDVLWIAMSKPGPVDSKGHATTSLHVTAVHAVNGTWASVGLGNAIPVYGLSYVPVVDVNGALHMAIGVLHMSSYYVAWSRFQLSDLTGAGTVQRAELRGSGYSWSAPGSFNYLGIGLDHVGNRAAIWIGTNMRFLVSGVVTGTPGYVTNSFSSDISGLPASLPTGSKLIHVGFRASDASWLAGFGAGGVIYKLNTSLTNPVVNVSTTVLPERSGILFDEDGVRYFGLNGNGTRYAGFIPRTHDTRYELQLSSTYDTTSTAAFMGSNTNRLAVGAWFTGTGAGMKIRFATFGWERYAGNRASYLSRVLSTGDQNTQWTKIGWTFARPTVLGGTWRVDYRVSNDGVNWGNWATASSTTASTTVALSGAAGAFLEVRVMLATTQVDELGPLLTAVTVFYAGGTSIVQSVPTPTGMVPIKAILAAEHSPGTAGSIRFSLSRDGGATWLDNVVPDQTYDLSMLGSGSSLILKAVLAGDATLTAWGATWS